MGAAVGKGRVAPPASQAAKRGAGRAGLELDGARAKPSVVDATSAGHLACSRCRIRVHATAPAIDLLEARCPICEAPLEPGPASRAIGLRLFDLDPFSEPGVAAALTQPPAPVDLVVRRDASSARRDGAAQQSRRLP